MLYKLLLPDNSMIESADLAIVTRVCLAKSLPESSIVFIDDSSEAQAFKSKAKTQIDTAANEVYSLFVQSPGLLKEYQQAEDDANAYLANPSIVPNSISSWAKPKKWTDLQAAQDILIQTARLRFLMSKIREYRLHYKEKIDAATSLVEIQELLTTGTNLIYKLRG